MKECGECKFFCGYDYSDGTPICEIDGGYEACPYCDYANTEKRGMKIEIDSGFMSDYISHTIKNTVESCAVSIAIEEIKSIITDDVKKKANEEVERQIEAKVAEEIESFMQKEITIGGGWSEPERTITRQQYLGELIEKEISSLFRSDKIKSYAEKEAKSAIDAFSRKLKDDVNSGVKTYFNQATRKTLTDNVVNLLMCNDTYKKLSDSMERFLK